jgi:hypothetical protein
VGSTEVEIRFDNLTSPAYETPGPVLRIPSSILARAGGKVSVPVHFTGNGHQIASTTFSVDFDETCLVFDPSDNNRDGIPDAVDFNLPATFNATVTFEDEDTDGELDFMITDLLPPLSSLPDGVLVTISFTAMCHPTQGVSIIAPVNFSDDPIASFGNTDGQSVPGMTINGSVEIRSGIPGDCNSDQRVDAGDISALALEIFDGDGSYPADTPGGTFPGDPVGCNANEDSTVDAGDISCTALLIFHGPGACSGTQSEKLHLNAIGKVASEARGAKGNKRSPIEVTSLEGPMLTIPDRLPAWPGGNLVVPINFTSNGNSISSLVFSVDYDEGWLTFDAADGNQDGIPDAITFDLPNAFEASVTFDDSDTDGELDFLIADLSPPLAPLPDGTIASITLKVHSPPETVVAALAFSHEPPPSFGDTSGRSITGITEGGSALIPCRTCILLLPLVTRR